MATKSMLKDIEIIDKESALNFINALDTVTEIDENNAVKNVEYMECKELSGKEISEFF